MVKITFEQIQKSKEVNAYITQGNKTLGELGYTEHSQKHAMIVSKTAAYILKELGYDEHTVQMTKIAGYMHDIGNCINRTGHPHFGGIMAANILRDMQMDFADIAVIINAIGMHDESTGSAVDAVSAALILADKTDVRRDRVRKMTPEKFDKHDRVNYAVTSSELIIKEKKKEILFAIELDEKICSMMDYFEIFLYRMLMCKKACEVLGLKFKMTANGNMIC